MGLFCEFSPLGNDASIHVLVEFLKICGKEPLAERNIAISHGKWQSLSEGKEYDWIGQFSALEYVTLHATIRTLVPSDVESVYPALLEYANTHDPNVLNVPGDFPYIWQLWPDQIYYCASNKFIVLAHLVMASGARVPPALMEIFIAATFGDLLCYGGKSPDTAYYKNARWENHTSTSKSKRASQIFLYRQQCLHCLEKYDIKGGTRWHVKEPWPNVYPFIDCPEANGMPSLIESTVARDKSYDRIASGYKWMKKFTIHLHKNMKTHRVAFNALLNQDDQWQWSKNITFFDIRTYFGNPNNNPSTNEPSRRGTLSREMMDFVDKSINTFKARVQSSKTPKEIEDADETIKVLSGLTLAKEDRVCSNCTKTAHDVKGNKLLSGCSGCHSEFYCSKGTAIQYSLYNSSFL